MRQYYKYWIAFEKLDYNGDHGTVFEESEKGTMERWRIDMSNPAAQWKECDRDGGENLPLSL